MAKSSKRLEHLEDAVTIVKQYPEAHLVIGHGSKTQYSDIDAVILELEPLLAAVQARCGDKPWLLIYGGDKAKPEAPDVGLLVQRLAASYNCRVMAPRVSAESHPPPPQPFVTHYHVMEPQYEGGFLATDPATGQPQQQQEQQPGSQQAAAQQEQLDLPEPLERGPAAQQQQQHDSQHQHAAGASRAGGESVGGGGAAANVDSTAEGAPTALGKRSQPHDSTDGDARDGADRGSDRADREVQRQRLADDDDDDDGGGEGARQLPQAPTAVAEQQGSEAAGAIPGAAAAVVSEQQPPPKAEAGASASAVTAACTASVSTSEASRPAPAAAQATGQQQPDTGAVASVGGGGPAADGAGGRGAQLWGGIIGGQPVGPSRFLLQEGLLGSGGRPRLLTSVIVAGGGLIAVQELDYAASRGVPWTYIRCRGRNPAPGYEFGQVDEWVQRQRQGKGEGQQQQQQQELQEQQQAKQ